MAQAQNTPSGAVSGLDPISYVNQNAPATVLFVRAARAPTTSDRRYKYSTLWLDTSSDQVYGLVKVVANSATWSLLGPGASDVDTLTGDSGGAISPSGGNITLSGGTNITTVGSGNKVTFNMDAAIVLATSVSSPLYTSAGNMDIRPPNANTLTIGGSSQTGQITIGNSTAAQTVEILGQTNTGAQVVTIAGGNNGADSTVNIFTGTSTAGTQAFNLFTGGRLGTTNIATGSAAHVVNIGSSSAGAIAVDTGAGISLDGATASNFTVTGSGQDLTLASAGGSVAISATEDAASAISMIANGGTSETIVIRASQGTGAGSVTIDSTAGGLTLSAALASADAINLSASAGGVDIDGALEVNITSSEASQADAVTISASAADGGITLDSGATPGVTFTNGTQSHQMLVGSGSPNGSITAAQGSMYVDVAGSTSTTILFVNTDGSTTWVGVGA